MTAPVDSAMQGSTDPDGQMWCVRYFKACFATVSLCENSAQILWTSADCKYQSTQKTAENSAEDLVRASKI